MYGSFSKLPYTPSRTAPTHLICRSSQNNAAGHFRRHFSTGRFYTQLKSLFWGEYLYGSSNRSFRVDAFGQLSDDQRQFG